MCLTIQSEIDKIKSIIIKHPHDAFISQEFIDSQWKTLNYGSRPEYKKTLTEYERFVDLLENEIQKIYYLPRENTVGLDSIYVRDTMISTDRGIILCNMGKITRRPETVAAEKFIATIDIPVLGRIVDPGRLEGGDIIWLDEKTLVVGRGYRTNEDGIQQLKKMTADIVENFLVVPLPHWKGPDDVFHLMSFISPVDINLAVVYSPLLPVFFRRWLLDRGIRLVEVPDAEFISMGCNVLAIEPRKCIMLEGNPITQKQLEESGAVVLTYHGENISLKGGGGPTCLTRPLHRSKKSD